MFGSSWNRFESIWSEIFVNKDGQWVLIVEEYKGRITEAYTLRKKMLLYKIFSEGLEIEFREVRDK